jgi:AraC-like DNA-binding protein
MLRETNKKIDTIAQQTGFQTSQNLCRSFQQRFGMTPRQFRIAEGYGQLDRSK